MRQTATLLLASLLLFSSACSSERQATRDSVEPARSDQVAEGVTSKPSAQPKELARAAETAAPSNASRSAGDDFSALNVQYKTQNISFDPNAQQPVTVVPDRKVIRNAELTLELDSPVEAQRRIASIAEAHGGFVVTSETRQDDHAGNRQSSQIVSVEMRVPAGQFDAVINAVHGVGGHVRDEKVSGKDVTEEYIDLEARLKAQRALETQILEIMKRAQKVSDALEVNEQLAQVRGEIERLEGRRRFLENQSSLSTIKITIQPPTPLVSAETTGFFTNIRRAFGDGVDFAAALLVGLVRVVVTLLPVAVLIFLPAWLAWRYARRRFRRAKPVEEWRPAAPTASA